MTIRLNKYIAITTGFILLMSSSITSFANVNVEGTEKVSVNTVQNDEQLNIKILKDDSSVRIVEVTDGNVVSTAIFNKITGTIVIEENGKLMTIDTLKTETLGTESYKQNYSESSSKLSTFAWGTPSGYSFSEGQEIWGLEYKIYTNDKDRAIRYWNVSGPNWNSSSMNETPGNFYRLERYKSLVNETQRKWLYAEGLLFAAGAGAVISAALYAAPEPFLSKGAATAALVAAGASASAALGAGGALYEYSQLYGETKRYYLNNF